MADKEDTIYWLGRIHAFMKIAEGMIMNYLLQCHLKNVRLKK